LEVEIVLELGLEFCRRNRGDGEAEIWRQKMETTRENR